MRRGGAGVTAASALHRRLWVAGELRAAPQIMVELTRDGGARRRRRRRQPGSKQEGQGCHVGMRAAPPGAAAHQERQGGQAAACGGGAAAAGGRRERRGCTHQHHCATAGRGGRVFSTHVCQVVLRLHQLMKADRLPDKRKLQSVSLHLAPGPCRLPTARGAVLPLTEGVHALAGLSEARARRGQGQVREGWPLAGQSISRLQAHARSQSECSQAVRREEAPWHVPLQTGGRKVGCRLASLAASGGIS